MSTEKPLNNFSLISRLFGNLFYRAPTDSVLAGVFDWLQQKGLDQVWALDADKESQTALDNLQLKIDLTLLNEEYQKLLGTEGKVATAISSYDIDVADFMAFRNERGMPEVERADHFALLLLTASWLEDNVDSVSAQRTLFEAFLLPCAAKFLTQIETYATLPFYRSLAYLTREILAAMADELEEHNRYGDL
ncbi:TorD/DmsD family molecular chaperone [Rodentibacter caecimuris]|uniref:TorD/DmsD family molecular chaperone n=1 Tax=Rodentibacter caecimuris TaxID=1796644 RepID=UPI0013A09F0D|nr:molecular chaperone [Rodentibacter heylii]QIA78105.1 molecular chaperone [Rodentibacter heylii]